MADDDVPLTPAPIDGNRAYGYLKQIFAMGPHPAGSEANTAVRQFVAKHFEQHGGTVREQPFRARHPLTHQPIEMVNLIGSWFPERKERVVIAAHYDSRPHPDEDPDPARRREPFIGANDPASSMALLMEIAQHLKDAPTPWGVDLVLFDGEELVYDRAGEFFLGSKAFSADYAARRKRDKDGSRYIAGIVLDLVGGRDLLIEREPYSLRLAPKLVRDVWDVADRLNVPVFSDNVGREVLDDHLPLNNVRIPTIDIIDFDYPFWHTADDTPENCSGESLANVGRVVTAWLNKPAPTPK